jgi:PAS domain S-box-containing protein
MRKRDYQLSPKRSKGSYNFIRKDTQGLAALYGLVRDLTRAPDLTAIADCLFGHSRQLLGAEFGFLLLAENSGTELRGIAAYGPHTDSFLHETVRVDELAPIALAFQQRQSLIIVDLPTSLQLSEDWRKKYHFVNSAWLVPLMSGAQAVGLLILGYTAPRQPTAKELRLLQLLGDEAALSLEQKRYDKAMRQSETLYRLMFEKNRAVKLLIDPESGAILEANPAAADFYGYSQEDLRRMRMSDLNVWPSAQATSGLPPLVDEPRSSFRFQHRLASGIIREVEVYSSSFLVDKRSLVHSVIHDVTEQVYTEKELRTLTADLKQQVDAQAAKSQWALSELQQFMRIASHDLQEPVQVIATYTQLLAQNSQDRLNAEAYELITTITESTKRLQRLMLDLLAYSEGSTRQMEYAWVDCETLIVNVLADLRGAIADRGATITHTLLPEVWGDTPLLQLVFRNLIHNGVKFHDRAPPSVHVSAERLDGAWRFAVQDNGAGVAPQLAERIFLPFQRLHVREPYPKPGIGLALSKKIIERHGGRIWLESQSGGGTTFYFTLPDQKSL